jgi:hypothetical protein
MLNIEVATLRVNDVGWEEGEGADSYCTDLAVGS